MLLVSCDFVIIVAFSMVEVVAFIKIDVYCGSVFFVVVLCRSLERGWPYCSASALWTAAATSRTWYS